MAHIENYNTPNGKLDLKSFVGKFLNTDGILPDLDGQHIAEYLKSYGYKVTKYHDTGRCGLVELDNGIKVSTNGYVYK